MKPEDEARFSGPAWRLALQVAELAEGELLADNRFLAPALALLGHAPARLARPLATDGRSLMIDADRLLTRFRMEREAPARDVAHLLIHCLLLHPFAGDGLDPACWSLAADIVAESLAAELAGPRPGERGTRERDALARISHDLDGRLTTERLYRRLAAGAWVDERDAWAGLFASDDHAPWYRRAPEHGAGGPEQDGGRARDGAGQEASGPSAAPDAPGAAADDDGTPGDEGQQAGKERQDQQHAAGPSQQDLQDAERRWEKAARSARLDLETLSRERGRSLSNLVRTLEVGQHEEADFREFLRQFAIQNEDLHVSDDEFDYVFYTYGLELYGDMPLIEPLEYRSEKRIRDFAIVLDTSSSVTGKTIQQFVDACFDVLASEGSFFQETDIHIIQADMAVRSDVVIRSLGDLDRWRRSVKVTGFGGTDFRPAIRYVRQLQQEGAFQDLRGLIYFTDGWGIYPSRMPPFPCAFVFYDEDHRPDLVPAWAIQLTLHPGEFESMSVY